MTESQNVYYRGAGTGVYFGLYLSALFFAMAYSMSVPGLSLLALAMMAAVPVIIYKAIRKMYIDEEGCSLFSGLWVYGIMIFFCGSLISAAVSVVFLKWLQPDFMAEQIEMSIEILKSSGLSQGKETADMLALMRDEDMMPGAVEMSIQMISFNVFSGSLLSMILSALVMARGYKK